VFARAHQNNKALKTSDLFPVEHDGDWTTGGLSYAHDLTSDAQAQLNTLDASMDINEIDIASLESIFQSNLDAYDEQTGTSNVLLNSLHTRVSGNETDIAAATTDLTSEGLRIDGLLGQTGNIEGAATALTARVSTLEAAPAAPTTVVQMTDVSSAGSGVIITAAERTLLNTHETEITALQNAGSGGGLTGDDTCTSSGALTKFQIENTGLNGQVEFLLADIDPTGDTNDHQYRYITQSNNLQLYAAFFQNHINKTENLVQSIGQNGNVVFHGAGVSQNANYNNQNFSVRGTARFFSATQFDAETTVLNNLRVGDVNTSYGITVNGVPLGNQIFTKHFDNEGGSNSTQTNSFQLDDGFAQYNLSVGDGLVQSANAHEIFFTAPANPTAGQRINLLILYPSYTTATKVWFLRDATNHTMVMPGGAGLSTTNPISFLQSSNGRKQHTLVYVVGRWVLHRTM
jgi:hypothetical protein